VSSPEWEGLAGGAEHQAGAEALDSWQVERAAARAALRDSDRRAFVSVLLGDGDDELAWEAATASWSACLRRDFGASLGSDCPITAQ